MDPDQQLMLRLQNGEKAALEVLFEKYHRPILNFCFRFLGNLHDAEDVVQETFIQVYRSAHRYRPLSKFSTWLYTIAKNLCLNRLRKSREISLDEMEQSNNSNTSRVESQAHSHEMTPEERLERLELGQVVQKSVMALPVLLRIPLILRRYHELSYKEIALVLECSETAAKLRVHRAKKILVDKLAPHLKAEFK